MVALPSISDLLACDPSVHTQLTLTLISALFWYFALPLAARMVVRPYIDKQPWKQQFIDIQQKAIKNTIGIAMDEDSVYSMATDGSTVLVQHGIGGILCIPSLLGILSPRTRTALACHGALCEVGWELQDTLVMARIWAFGSDKEKKTKPPALVALMLMHHALGLLMVIPMNLSFPDYYYYHEGIFLLQFVAFVALFVQMYGYTLDTRTPSGLRQMQISVTFVVLLMGWSRGVRYAVVVYHVLGFLRSEASTAMFVGGCVGSTLMAVMNAALMFDSVGKFRKFMVVSMKAEKTEEDHELLREGSPKLLRSLSHHSVHESFSAGQEWGKVRAAVKMGIFRKLHKKDS